MADDFDSEMLSSTSSSPSARSVPQTPAVMGLDGNPGNAMGELSPPGSQDVTGLQKAADEDGMDVRDQDEYPLNSGFRGGEMAVDSATQASAALRDEPGAGWMDKKFQDDAQKTLENIVDRDFNLKEFGDPFDDRDVDPTEVKPPQ